MRSASRIPFDMLSVVRLPAIFLATAAIFLATVMSFAGPAMANHYVGWHFPTSGGSVPVVTFVDYTDQVDRLAVRDAVTSWDGYLGHVNAVYVAATGNDSACSGKTEVDLTDYTIPICSYPIGLNDGEFHFFKHAETGCVGDGGFGLPAGNCWHNRRGYIVVHPNAAFSYSRTRSIICQESGHAFGLDHRASDLTCMDNTGFYPTQPDGHDVNYADGVGDWLTQGGIYGYPDFDSRHYAGGPQACIPSCPQSPQPAPADIRYQVGDVVTGYIADRGRDQFLVHHRSLAFAGIAPQLAWLFLPGA